MTQKRTGDTWMHPDEYGRSLPLFTVNLMASDIARSLDFYQQVLGARVIYSDVDFAALEIHGLEFMLHADHTYDHHPWFERLAKLQPRGLGAEIRLRGPSPDDVEARARRHGAVILQASKDMPHGWRDVIVADPDGYAWAVGVAFPKPAA